MHSKRRQLQPLLRNPFPIWHKECWPENHLPGLPSLLVIGWRMVRLPNSSLNHALIVVIATVREKETAIVKGIATGGGMIGAISGTPAGSVILGIGAKVGGMIIALIIDMTGEEVTDDRISVLNAAGIALQNPRNNLKFWYDRNHVPPSLKNSLNRTLFITENLEMNLSLELAHMERSSKQSTCIPRERWH